MAAVAGAAVFGRKRFDIFVLPETLQDVVDRMRGIDQQRFRTGGPARVQIGHEGIDMEIDLILADDFMGAIQEGRRHEGLRGDHGLPVDGLQFCGKSGLAIERCEQYPPGRVKSFHPALQDQVPVI